LVGATILALIVVLALMSFAWTPHNPLLAVPENRLAPPSAAHLFGTDRLGRDVLSGVIAGSRVTVVVGFITTIIGVTVGVPIGILAGHLRGVIGNAFSKGFDLLLAFPGLLLAMIFAAAFGASTVGASIALGIASIPNFARVASAGTHSILVSDYVAAARISKRSGWSIATGHVLPGILGQVVVQAALTFGIAVLAEAALSFLGIGTPPPTPSWGRMLQDSQAFIGTNLNLILAPGLAIGLTVFACNLVGNGLRDLTDPRLRDRR
jgi:peptide/nickel transport system permease protein